MSDITAAAVKALREKTGLPMMDCKKALEASGGDEAVAIEELRKKGKQIGEKRAGKETSAGRIAVCLGENVGAMVEFLCESAPVAANDEFIDLANDMAKQLATGPGAKSADELLDQPSAGKPGKKLRDRFDDLTNRVRELFKVGRVARIDAACGGYAHHNGGCGVLLEVSGKVDAGLAKDVCMHIAAIRPKVVGVANLDPAGVAKEKEILAAAARREGKPEKIIEKMVEGRLKNFYAEQCLEEQPFVKDDSQTVAKAVGAAGMKIVRFIHWEIGKE
jgi:elongation factor Ts